MKLLAEKYHWSPMDVLNTDAYVIEELLVLIAEQQRQERIKQRRQEREAQQVGRR